MNLKNNAINFINKKGSLIRNLLILTLLSLFTSHLTDYDPDEGYSFPLISTISSIIIGTVIGIIADRNFKYFERKQLFRTVNWTTIFHYIFSTLGFITLAYLPFYFLAIWIAKAEFLFYYFFIGLLLTLLLSIIAIALLYGEKIYKLHKFGVIQGQLTVKKNGRTSIISYSDIAYFYSQEKIVYLVKNNNDSIITDFTLQKLDELLNEQLFFRANRQVIVHINAIQEIISGQNGKLILSLKPNLSDKNLSELAISRYKKKEFMIWFENKLDS
ncbi:LytTR family DNA-binding domain-containing protein [uncultured Tenacibaculum sp.]|uniref:LytR/AlgR family response regulator transcription factor n=1 Tax=uncultured Tenacibaculum sp. TaxID=174713 RepID=UPI00262C6455|nr:LytTR family DNA-binding domain-containing protein [uncultured Tenacibaculum sp.]